MPHHIFDLIEVYRYFKSSFPFVRKDCPSKDMSVHILTQTLHSPPPPPIIFSAKQMSRGKNNLTICSGALAMYRKKKPI